MNLRNSKPKGKEVEEALPGLDSERAVYEALSMPYKAPHAASAQSIEPVNNISMLKIIKAPKGFTAGDRRRRRTRCMVRCGQRGGFCLVWCFSS